MTSLTLASLHRILERTPSVVRTMLEGLDASWLKSPYGPNTWSAHEIVAHLIHGERTDWIPRARHILAHGSSTPFEPFDRAGHADLARSHSTAALLDLFAQERAASLVAFASFNLSGNDLTRPGLHPALGPVTLGQLLSTWAVHDLNHIAQIAKAMAFQEREHVGAWANYLSILAPPNPR